MKSLNFKWLIALIISAITLTAPSVQAQELKASEMPKMGKELRKLNKACSSVTNNFRKGKDLAKDLEKATKAYETVIAKTPEETVAANYHMADMYWNIKSWDESFKWFKQTEAALTTDDHFYGQGTHNKLGWSYYIGRGCEVNEQKAVEHFAKEFEFDPVKGNWDNALVYMIGMNGEKSDCIMALNLFNLAENVMIRWPRIYELEYYLENRDRISDETWENFLKGFTLFTVYSDADNAIPYLEKAIEGGYIPACVLLADLYLGQGKGYAKAIDVVTPATNANYPPALHQNGYYMELSTLGKFFQWEEMAQTASLYMKGAEFGYPPSQITAGYMHLNGYGKAIAKNSEVAYKWFETAMQNGEPSASKGKDLAAATINKEAWQRIANEVQNIGNKVEAIISHYTSKSGASSSTSSYVGTSESSSSTSSLGNTNRAEIMRHENYYKKYISYGEAEIKRYNRAVAEQKVCDAKDDWIGFRQAGDTKSRAISAMKSTLRSMEHHRQKAAKAGGNIPVSDVEAAMRALI